MDDDDVRDFYDRFLESHMLRYRLTGRNERIERAVERITSVVRPGDTVLDVGCGIGIVAEQVAARFGESIRCWACDLSPRNIWYANKTVDSPNVTFFVADIVHGFDEITNTVSEVDVVTMVDVLEHIPSTHHGDLMRNLADVTAADARLIFTYPSPAYQAHLRREAPEDLQIIDEDVDIDALNRLAMDHGFTLKHYSLQDIWMRNQYVHAVFERNASLEAVERTSRTFVERVRIRLGRVLDRTLLRRYRKWKYVDRVFEDPR